MKNFLKSYLFITVIIFLFVFDLPSTNYSLSTAYADDDNSGGGNNDGGSVSGGDVGGESISGSATDENGNTTSFDSQGNITGETGPDGSPVSDGTTQGPGATGQQADGPTGPTAPVSGSPTGSTPISAPGSALSEAEANVISAATSGSPQQLAEAIQNWTELADAYSDSLSKSSSYSFSLEGTAYSETASLNAFAAYNQALAEEAAKAEEAGKQNPAAAPAAAPVPVDPVPPPAPTLTGALQDGYQASATSSLSTDGKFTTANSTTTISGPSGFVGTISVQTTYDPGLVGNSSFPATATTTVNSNIGGKDPEAQTQISGVQVAFDPTTGTATALTTAEAISAAKEAGISVPGAK